MQKLYKCVRELLNQEIGSWEKTEDKNHIFKQTVILLKILLKNKLCVSFTYVCVYVYCKVKKKLNYYKN